MCGCQVMLVPMEPYPYFVSEISSVLYCVVYFPILYWQSRVHNFSILAPVKRFWKFFLLVGFLDGVGDTTGLVAARHISGALLTLLPKERTVPFRVWVVHTRRELYAVKGFVGVEGLANSHSLSVAFVLNR